MLDRFKISNTTIDFKPSTIICGGLLLRKKEDVH